MDRWLAVVAMALAVATGSMTVTRSKVFKPLRWAIQRRSVFFGDLITCPYCFSHWVAFAIVAWFRPRLVESSVPLVDYAVSAFAVVALATYGGGLIFRAFAVMPPPSTPDEEEEE